MPSLGQGEVCCRKGDNLRGIRKHFLLICLG